VPIVFAAWFIMIDSPLIPSMELQMYNSPNSLAPESGLKCVGRFLLKCACVGMLLVSAMFGFFNDLVDAEPRSPVTVEAPVANAPAPAAKAAPSTQNADKAVATASQPAPVVENSVGQDELLDCCKLIGHEVSRFTSFTLRETDVHLVVGGITLELAWTFALVALGLIVASKILRVIAQYFGRKYDVGPALPPS
jgi:hypothetical protein